MLPSSPVDGLTWDWAVARVGAPVVGDRLKGEEGHSY